MEPPYKPQLVSRPCWASVASAADAVAVVTPHLPPSDPITSYFTPLFLSSFFISFYLCATDMYFISRRVPSFAAVWWRREPVWHQVHQTDASGQSRRHLAQPQRRARLCGKPDLYWTWITSRSFNLSLYSFDGLEVGVFPCLFFEGFHLCGSISPGKSEGRFLIWTPDSNRAPPQQQPTHTHQVKPGDFLRPPGRSVHPTTPHLFGLAWMVCKVSFFFLFFFFIIFKELTDI